MALLVNYLCRRCAEAITFNDYTLINETVTPRGMKLGVGDDRRFFNLQALGKDGRSFWCIVNGLFRVDDTLLLHAAKEKPQSCTTLSKRGRKDM